MKFSPQAEWGVHLSMVTRQGLGQELGGWEVGSVRLNMGKVNGSKGWCGASEMNI